MSNPHAFENPVSAAYGARAAEYTRLLGSVDDMHPLDRSRITEWAMSVEGRLLDLGCGPGHWTAHLAHHGVDAHGIDLTPEFVRVAQQRFPELAFAVGDARSLEAGDGSLGGVLAWYSLIHAEHRDLDAQLREIARVLSPGGRLLVGFFDGPADEPFEHAVTTAFTHSPQQFREMLGAVGFDVIDVERRQNPPARPHASISAIRV